MEWHKSKRDREWYFNHNPFIFTIFLLEDGIDCILSFGLERESATIPTINVEDGKEFCMNWAKQKLKELNDDFEELSTNGQ